VFLARDLKEADTPVSADEKFKIRKFKEPYSKLLKYIQEGRITDGPTIVATQFLRDYLEK
jgi:hypothetical protein